jgi:hypothetical protein
MNVPMGVIAGRIEGCLTVNPVCSGANRPVSSLGHTAQRKRTSHVAAIPNALRRLDQQWYVPRFRSKNLAWASAHMPPRQLQSLQRSGAKLS